MLITALRRAIASHAGVSMPEKTTVPVCQTIRHSKTADKDLTRFRRVLGSIALRGSVPSKKFLEENVTEGSKRRARR
jgi:hypothetical protein